MAKIRVLIVDDSAFMRKLITDFLSEQPEIEVLGTARNGEDAIKKWRELRPDVITMDVEMPVMNGLEVLKVIMEEEPVPVVMLSSTTKEGADTTFQAIQAGAVDFVAKPSGSISIDLHKIKAELIEKVLSASRANLSKINIQHQPGTAGRAPERTLVSQKRPSEHVVKHWAPKDPAAKKLVCIGTSTGGPRALQQVLTSLPKDIGAPILVVQHMPPGFTKSLANRLDSLSEIHVKEAEDGELLQKGTAYIAPGGWHLEVKSIGTSLAVSLSQTPPRNGHRPSVDVMFESISTLRSHAKIAVIMTGMGSDGAKGLSEMKKNGSVKAIAESQETSIVFGMPKAAIATNLVDDVANVENIAQTIMNYI
ncbi:protein-glutamate methylesterase/protein-glutamine glutaminase [Mesobacillus subterraneus]|uniref:Protein-glutamate methylesterase/protein-glutamine glutaminase n=1 Tax=Mesobacillus subterraneus TaxID=285983 RepID=A0A3R9EDM5_9BACI|nr:chemotaxis response regulator protein-glutamate methylesterase [Mesobacillus subterraneus]RSD28005.1 chemotaxis response regulator protein-glutamate methylesterase [Mesobacillus subterraneus]